MSGKQPDIYSSALRSLLGTGNKGPIKSHFTDCEISPTEDDVSIMGKPKRGEYRLLTLEALFIKVLAPVFNTKDEYSSRTLIANYILVF